MKILKYKKVSGNKYSLVLDNGDNIKLYDDTIIKFDLLRSKEIRDIEEINKYDKDMEAYYKCVQYLNRKMRTSKEIRKYLEDYPAKTIDITIERLCREGYLNDEYYLKVFISNQINITNNGPFKITKKLKDLGFNKDEILEELNKYDYNIFINKLDKMIDKKINNNSKYSNNRLKEKIIIDFVNYGYDKKDIINILNNKEVKISREIIEKEYKKALRSLIKKYEGYELESKLIAKLMSKGFFYDEIKEIISKNK